MLKYYNNITKTLILPYEFNQKIKENLLPDSLHTLFLVIILIKK